MPALRSPHTLLYATRPGALPARFRRERVLLVGCGDVGLRVARQLDARVRLLALTSQAGRAAELRALGITPLVGNLDKPASLKRLSGLATRVLHLAPPPGGGAQDPRTQALLQVLRRRSSVQSLVYGSTSGVYGDCQGEVVTEERALNAATARAQRRIDAEQRIRHFGRAAKVPVNILRIPGIYAPDREGGSPRTAQDVRIYACMNALMLPGRQVFLVDTHVNHDPSAEELCEITVMAAEEMLRFGITPKAALLSHSNFGNSDQPSAVKMRRALALLREQAPWLEVDGEMHGDLALDGQARKVLMPNSTLTGDANLLVFPNMDSANIAYNLLKTAAGGNIAIGPVLLGAAKPVHVLTASTTVRRIVNMTALTVADANAARQG